jgi:hypothetical protein
VEITFSKTLTMENDGSQSIMLIKSVMCYAYMNSNFLFNKNLHTYKTLITNTQLYYFSTVYFKKNPDKKVGSFGNVK